MTQPSLKVKGGGKRFEKSVDKSAWTDTDLVTDSAKVRISLFEFHAHLIYFLSILLCTADHSFAVERDELCLIHDLCRSKKRPAEFTQSWT